MASRPTVGHGCRRRRGPFIVCPPIRIPRRAVQTRRRRRRRPRRRRRRRVACGGGVAAASCCSPSYRPPPPPMFQLATVAPGYENIDIVCLFHLFIIIYLFFCYFSVLRSLALSLTLSLSLSAAHARAHTRTHINGRGARAQHVITHARTQHTHTLSLAPPSATCVRNDNGTRRTLIADARAADDVQDRCTESRQRVPARANNDDDDRNNNNNNN